MERVAIVTGGGRGIGRATARRLAEDGAAVAVADIDVGSAEETAAKLEGAMAVHVDVASVGSVRAMARAVEEGLGPVDLLVNNAGWDRVVPFVDSDEALWDKVITINLKGQIACAHTVLPGMIERRRGRIVCVASDAARVGSSGEVVYSAAKGGVMAFAKALAREVARDEICVKCVAPGPTGTPLLEAFLQGDGNERIVDAMVRSTPLRRLAKPEETAAAAAFLASDDAAFITGQTLSVSGGLTMIQAVLSPSSADGFARARVSTTGVERRRTLPAKHQQRRRETPP